MGNEALPLTRAHYGMGDVAAPFQRVRARYGLVNFFKATAGYLLFTFARRLMRITNGS